MRQHHRPMPASDGANRGGQVLFWILLFLASVLGSSVLGHGGASALASGIAKALFAVVLLLIVVSWVAGRGRMG
jgi:uncharacterized membrane protein YtjA (UPF0391 family)